MFRERLPERVRLTPVEERKLVRLGAPLGVALKEIISKPRLLIQDRDTKYGTEFQKRLRTRGCHSVRLPICTPQLNIYAERWIKSCRRECLDHFVAFGQRHLGYLLRQYVAYYHRERPWPVEALGSHPTWTEVGVKTKYPKSSHHDWIRILSAGHLRLETSTRSLMQLASVNAADSN
ncbi:MAG: hypothetical protein U0637_13015 [Phycisphaerales bacterium]